MPDTEVLEADVASACGPAAIAPLRAAFTFFRQHADRRYSSKTLMALIDNADRLEGTGDRYSQVTVVTVSIPFTYDEETEVKSGGVLGMGVLLPDRRILIAVRASARRQGLGRLIFENLDLAYVPTSVMWLNRYNAVGQQFALAMGLVPQEMRPSGAVAYSLHPLDDALADVAMLEDEAPPRRRHRLEPRMADEMSEEEAMWAYDSGPGTLSGGEDI
jgi:hypothetical protein